MTTKRFAIFSLLACLPIFAACGAGSRIVVKTVVVKQKLPESLLVRCAGKDMRPWPNVEAIIATADMTETARANCAAQVDKIIKWNGAGQ